MKTIVPILLALLSAVTVYGSGVPPLWSLETQPGGAERLRVLGPFFEYSSAPNSSMLAVRPLFSTLKKREIEGDSRYFDALWPFFMYRDAWHGSFRLFLLYFRSAGENDARSGILPLWFGRVDENGNYSWAFLPFYGDISSFPGFGRSQFVLFPLYWKSVKGRDESISFLWPLVCSERSPDKFKFRALPFYAVSVEEGHRRTESIMFPLFSSSESLDKKYPGYGWLFWPFYGHSMLGDTESWTFAWPIFSYSQRARGSGWRLNAPWPFLRFGKNMVVKGDSMQVFWPFYGRRSAGNSVYSYAVWPFCWRLREENESGVSRRFRVAPFYWQKIVESKKNPAVHSSARAVWPFYSCASAGDVLNLRVPDPVPNRDYPVVDRNLSPLWTVFRFRSTAHSVEWNLLWGMASRRKDETGSSFEISPFCRFDSAPSSETEEYFFGLVRTVRSPEGLSLRLFYLPPLDFRKKQSIFPEQGVLKP